MIIVEIVAAFLALVFLILLLPFSYSLSFEKWILEIKVSLLLGLVSKRKIFSLPDDDQEEPEEEDAEEAMEELDHALDAWEETMGPAGPGDEEVPDKKEKEEIGPTGSDEKGNGEKEISISHQDEEETPPSKEKAHPSYLAQFRFALENGLVERCLGSLSLLISHGFPKTLEVKGNLGLGDPMHTGILCGMVYAFLPKAAEEIRWNYVDKECTLTGKSRGRLIPMYVLYILIKLALSKSAREFWHFRQGGNDNG